MRLMKSLKMLAAICLLSSCAHKYQVPNVEPCLELASGGAFCKKFLTGEEREESAFERSTSRIGNVSLSPEDWGSLKIYMNNTCAFLNNCPKELLQKVESVEAAFDGAE